MMSLREKASRFFKDSPTQDEKVANSEPGATDFDASIPNRNVKKKPSHFFLRKCDKTNKKLPASPYNASSSALPKSEEPEKHQDDQSGDNSNVKGPDGLHPFPPTPSKLEPSPELLSAPGSTCSSVKPGNTRLKPAPSFAALRSKSSRFFRNKDAQSSSPPKLLPVPQMPVGLVPPQPRPVSTLSLLHSTRNSACSSRSSFAGLQSGQVSISRPALLPQYSNLYIPENPATVPFTKPGGPPPERPSRPERLDTDIIAFMQQSGTRMVLPVSNRVSGSTASNSTPRSHTSSIEARLGLPSGMGTPRNFSLDSPLAARFPLDALQPLQVRDSMGDVKTSRSSQFVKIEAGAHAGDGVDDEDRELGPIEQYDATKGDDWKLEKRVSQGPNGNSGMLFRDRRGAFHFVADI